MTKFPWYFETLKTHNNKILLKNKELSVSSLLKRTAQGRLSECAARKVQRAVCRYHTMMFYYTFLLNQVSSQAARVGMQSAQEAYSTYGDRLQGQKSHWKKNLFHLYCTS